jgi:hypothetical protein
MQANTSKKMEIENVIREIKNVYEAAILSGSFNGQIYTNGLEAKQALIRSQQIINLIHEFVKSEFVNLGIRPSVIFPPVGQPSPEIKLRGFLKSKNQDLCLIPFPNEVSGSRVSVDDELMDQIISVNIRSQLSSLRKNIDTLYERTFAEALNLHLINPNQCLGEVYLIPTHEYDDIAMKENRIAFKRVSDIAGYIKMFQAINKRASTGDNDHKYERVSLMVVDFRQDEPILYESISELVNDGLLEEGHGVSMDGLSIRSFAEDLLSIYGERFDLNRLTNS